MNETVYIDKLKAKLEKSLPAYFPEDNLKIVNIKKVSELYKSELETITYKCELSGAVAKVLYVKYFTPHKIKKIGGIKKLSGFNTHKHELNIPTVFDVYGDLDAVVFDGASGKKLSSHLPIYLLPIFRRLKYSMIKNALEKVAKSTAVLHKMSYEKSKQIVTCFNDLKMGNVLVDGDEITIIDFEMVKAHYLEDVTSFLTSLEMVQKFPHVGKNTVSELKNIFFKTYSSEIDWKIDPSDFEDAMNKKRQWILDTLIDKDSMRGVGFFGRMIMKWNASYLRKTISKPS